MTARQRDPWDLLLGDDEGEGEDEGEFEGESGVVSQDLWVR